LHVALQRRHDAWLHRHGTFEAVLQVPGRIEQVPMAVHPKVQPSSKLPVHTPAVTAPSNAVDAGRQSGSSLGIASHVPNRSPIGPGRPNASSVNPAGSSAGNDITQPATPSSTPARHAASPDLHEDPGTLDVAGDVSIGYPPSRATRHDQHPGTPLGKAQEGRPALI
jgi:hypothetical protein